MKVKEVTNDRTKMKEIERKVKGKKQVKMK